MTPLGDSMVHEDRVDFVAFSPDGEQVLTGSADGMAQLWDTRTGVPLGEPLRHERPVTSLVFSPDGKRVLTGTWDKTVWLWMVNPAVIPRGEQHFKRCFEILIGTVFPSNTLTSPRQLTSTEWNERWEILKQQHEPFLEQIRQRSFRRSLDGHRYAAREAEETGHWFAAEFHLRHLLRVEPDNQDIKSRHDRAVRELERAKIAAKSPQGSDAAPNPVIAEAAK